MTGHAPAWTVADTGQELERGQTVAMELELNRFTGGWTFTRYIPDRNQFTAPVAKYWESLSQANSRTLSG
jgi:hypothetical protein